MRFNAKIEVVHSDRKMLELMFNALRQELTMLLQGNTHNLEKLIREEVRRRIVATSTWNDLTSGKLQGILGLNYPDLRLNDILKVWLDSIKVNIKPLKRSGLKWSGGLLIVGIQSDWVDVTSLRSANIVSGYHTLPWLSWLLTSGNRILIRDYEVKTDLNTLERKFSRSGKAIMSHKIGEVFQIPSEYQGTTKDNFVTRALTGINDYIESIIIKELS